MIELNKIYCMDCIEGMKMIPDGSVDLIVTDPPYNIGKSGGGDFGYKNRAYHDEIADFSFGIQNDYLEEMCRVMKKINIYIWCNKEQFRQYIDFFCDKGAMLSLLCWHKTNPIPQCANKWLGDTEYCLHFREHGVRINGSYHEKRTWFVTNANKKDKEKYGHPTIKPFEIIKNLVSNSSCDGDLVLDPFIGSGTTAVACKQLGRNYIGFEKDDKHFHTAVKRVNEYQLTIPI